MVDADIIRDWKEISYDEWIKWFKKYQSGSRYDSMTGPGLLGDPDFSETTFFNPKCDYLIRKVWLDRWNNFRFFKKPVVDAKPDEIPEHAPEVCP